MRYPFARAKRVKRPSRSSDLSGQLRSISRDEIRSFTHQAPLVKFRKTPNLPGDVKARWERPFYMPEQAMFRTGI